MTVSPYKRCLMILADGTRPDVFQSLVDRGELPNISRIMVEPGSLATGITSFPSTTGPAYMPFITGCHPGTCQVPGIRWFDKDVYAARPWSHNKFRSYVGIESFLMNRDMNPELQTLFELCNNSMNIFSSVNKGVSFFGNKTKFFRMWNWYYAHLTDRWSMIDHSARNKIVKHMKKDPEFLFAVFPGPDEYAHMSDPFQPETIDAYREIDATIGDVAQLLKERGWLEETIIMIVSDHGLSATHSHLGVNQLLEKKGFKSFFYPVIFKKGFNVASMVSGNAMNHLYFPKQNGHSLRRKDWQGVTYEEDFSSEQADALQAFLQEPAVDIMAMRSRDGSIVAKSQRGTARIKRLDGKISYQCGEGDPFGYQNMPAQFTDEESLRLTAESDHPDAPVQLLQIFKTSRAGDVILSAAKGYDLRDRHEIHEHKSSHGSLHREHMLIPIISNVRFNQDVIRSVDVFPTVCELMGKQWTHQIDGQSRIG